MNNTSEHRRGRIRSFVIAGSILLAVILSSVLYFSFRHNSTDVGRAAEKMSAGTQERLEQLSLFGQKLSGRPQRNEIWPVLDGFPDDMVIYKYVSDTLYSWYNILGPCDDDIRPGHGFKARSVPYFDLSRVGKSYSAVNMSGEWYVIRRRNFDEVSIFEALRLSRPAHFDIAALDEGEGAVVNLYGKAAFKMIPREKVSDPGLDDRINDWLAVYGVFLFPLPMFLLVLVAAFLIRRRLAKKIEEYRVRGLLVTTALYAVVMLVSIFALKAWYYREVDRIDALGHRFAARERADFGSDLLNSSVYTCAKYHKERLVSFDGFYEYPVVFRREVTFDEKGHASLFENGCHHFIIKIDDDTIVVVSRKERESMTHFFLYAAVGLFLLLAALFFVHNDPDAYRHRKYFSSKLRWVVVYAMLVAMLVMGIVSIVFVSGRLENNRKNMLSAKISAIQARLNEECATFTGSGNLSGREFEEKLRVLARGASSTINIYTSSGRFVVSSAGAGCNSEDVLRVDSESFREITFNYSRYHIKRNRFGTSDLYVIYAPVFNDKGVIVAIMGIPYLSADNDFVADAVFHSVMLVGLFSILLLAAVIFLSSITASVFRPLLAIGQKMNNTDAEKLEPIEYKGEDEISSLVAAYNRMVTELKRSTAQLAAAERDKAWSEMARQIAHEIKNPLTPIKLEIQHLVRLKQRNDPSFNEKFDSVADVVLEHVDILSQTANEFSTFAKLYTEEPVEMDLDKILKDQIMLYSDKGVDITYLGIENSLFQGPKPQMIRVCVNLLNNAFQAVKDSEDPKVIVTLRKGSEPGHWTITFEDNGPGVAPENLDKLFTPYFTTKSSGSGLGLAICRSIVDKIGGSVSYSRSFTLGGACFSVNL